MALVYDDKAEEQLNPGCARGLVWLVGMDGMDGNTNALYPEETEILNRMLARRGEPVGVPSADRMPPGVPDPYNDGTESR